MSAIPSDIHKIHYFRTINGKRVAYCLTLDANRNFIHDGEAAEVKGKQPAHFIDKFKQEPENIPPEHSAQIEHLKRNGIDYSLREDGGIVINSVGPQMSHQLKLFNKHTPCWFAGCEQLRTRYFEEIQELQNRPGCNTDCAQAKIMRKYLIEAASYPGFLL